MFEPIDMAIIAAMQADLPLTEEPFRHIAQSIGISQEELLARLQGYRETGKLRKLGAVLRHHQIGFSANALCAWQVPPERLDEVGCRLAAEPDISHCYARQPREQWPYNLYTMLHARSREECDRLVRQLAAVTGVEDYILLYTRKEWKKTSMSYFSERKR